MCKPTCICVCVGSARTYTCKSRSTLDTCCSIENKEGRDRRREGGGGERRRERGGGGGERENQMFPVYNSLQLVSLNTA